jgi:hypothetical protein
MIHPIFVDAHLENHPSLEGPSQSRQATQSAKQIRLSERGFLFITVFVSELVGWGDAPNL